MKKISCCYECDHRHLGCHATCEDYIKEKTQRERDREAMFHSKKEYDDVNGCEVARSIRARKYVGKK